MKFFKLYKPIFFIIVFCICADFTRQHKVSFFNSSGNPYIEFYQKTEKEILLETGETYVPDRLVFDGNKVVVIDYKTGDEDPKHKKLIINYANTLEKMGYEVLSTDLIYTKKILKS